MLLISINMNQVSLTSCSLKAAGIVGMYKQVETLRYHVLINHVSILAGLDFDLHKFCVNFFIWDFFSNCNNNNRVDSSSCKFA